MTMATATIARAGGSGQVQQASQQPQALSNHRHNQPLMEAVEVVVEVEEAVEVVVEVEEAVEVVVEVEEAVEVEEVDQHPLQEAQHSASCSTPSRIKWCLERQHANDLHQRKRHS